MARSRNIKPSIMANEELAELEPLSRLLFIYLWMLADKAGRLEDRPKRIAAQALPYDRSADVDAILNDLQRGGFIVRYVSQGVACIEISSFAKHQNPHVRESESELPGQSTTKAVPEHNLGSVEASPRSPDSLLLIPDSLIVDTAQDKPAPTPRKKKTEKTQLPENFAISERVQEWAKENRFDRLDEHLDAFRRKATARGYSYASWDDAFMEAIREDWAKLRTVPRQGYSGHDPTATVPSKPGIDPALAKAIKDSLSGAKPSAEIRQRMAEIKGARA